MLSIQMDTIPDQLKGELYKLIHEAVKEVQEDRQKERDLPYLLSKKQLAEDLFNCSEHHLDAHILKRADFPKIRIGRRIQFPRDLVLQWIIDHTEMTDEVAHKRNVRTNQRKEA